ncbi:MAG: hypothetical protein ABIQ72_09655 [Usitatibacter sp.]
MKLLLAVAASALGYCYYRGCEVKKHSHKTAVKEDLTRWEGEGGNVPAVATPAPVVTPRSSRPDGEPLRH